MRVIPCNLMLIEEEEVLKTNFGDERRSYGEAIMTQSLTPRVFVSAVSSDLRSARKVVNDALTRIECLPIEESVFGTEYGSIREMISRKIESCQAVIHLVGRDLGGEPDSRTLPTGQSRRSWTQIEYDLAKEQNRKLYLLVCDDAFPFDSPAVPEPADKSAVQLAHRQQILDDRNLWHKVGSEAELRQQVERMKLGLDMIRAELVTVSEKVTKVGEQIATVDKSVMTSGRKLGRWLVTLVALVLLSVGIGGSAVKRLASLTFDTTTANEVKQQFAKGFLDHLIRDKNLSVEDARRQALADLPKMPPLSSLKSDEIQRIIDGRIMELAKDVGAMPLDRERAKLTIGDYDGVLTEAANQRTKTRELEILEGTAYLAKFRKQPRPEWNEKALTAFNRALALFDDKTEPVAWANSALLVADVLQELARYSDAEPLLRNALNALEGRQANLGPNDAAIAIALNKLALLLQVTNRLAEAKPLILRALAIDEKAYGEKDPRVARDLNNLALLLQDMDSLRDAEVRMRRALAIDEQFNGAGHLDVARDLNNLASLLRNTNRRAEAEPLIRHALAIDEETSGPEHPNVARDLGNLALLLQDTSHRDKAEPLMRRALAIDRQAFGTEHPKVAVRLNNLAQLLRATSRLDDAERLGATEALMRRALAIGEQSFGTEHPDVALRLNDLAQLLQDKELFEEAELLMRRALAIDEKSYGPGHSSVAASLSTLAHLLQANNRRAQAEPLMCRALTIAEKSYGTEHPIFAIRLNNLAHLLADTDHLAEADAHLLAATDRLAEAEPLYRRALAIDEKSYGAEHPDVAIDLNNLAQLLQETKRLTEAEPLMTRCIRILCLFKRQTNYEHPRWKKYSDNYRKLLQKMSLLPDEIDQRIQSAIVTAAPLKPIVPEVERLLGQAQPVVAVLAELDRHHKTDESPIYFLPLDQPVVPHLDQLLGRSKLNVRLNEPIVPHLEKLLGPAKSIQEVFVTLDRQYPDQNKSEKIWFLPLSQRIAPHLDELLGPLPAKEKE